MLRALSALCDAVGGNGSGRFAAFWFSAAHAFEDGAWWWGVRGKRDMARRALSGVQEARTCLEERKRSQIGAAIPADPEQLAIEAWEELREVEVRLRELADYHD